MYVNARNLTQYVQGWGGGWGLGVGGCSVLYVCMCVVHVCGEYPKQTRQSMEHAIILEPWYLDGNT